MEQHSASPGAADSTPSPCSLPDAFGSLRLPCPTLSECRICQEEDDAANLETPCFCSGSLQYAHRKCVQRWCNEKGDTTCEICRQPYRSGYTTPQVQLQSESVSIDISEEWGIPGTHPMELRNPRILAIAAAQRRFLEAEYEEYAAANSTSAACCRSVALILTALLLLRHALAMTTTTEEDASMYFIIFLLRLVGFFLPCYIMARAMDMLQRKRRGEIQAASIATGELTVLLQSGHPGGIRVSLTPAFGDLP